MRNASSIKKELPPTGLQNCRLTKIIDLGIQKPGNPKFKEAHKVSFEFELVDTSNQFSRDKGPEPFVISKELSVSGFKTSSNSTMNNLRLFLETWRGSSYTDEELKPFLVNGEEVNIAAILVKLLGKTAIINIVHKPKPTKPSEKKAEIAGISTPSEEAAKKIKRPHNPMFFFDMGNPKCKLFLKGDKEWRAVPWTELFNNYLYKFLQEKVQPTEDFIEAAKKDGFVPQSTADAVEADSDDVTDANFEDTPVEEDPF